MTRHDALREAEICLREAKKIGEIYVATNDAREALASKMEALAKIAQGWINLAAELRQRA